MKSGLALSCRSLSASAALAAVLALSWPGGEARAACAPTSPVSDADVTCTGTTANQNAPNGYGTNTDTGNTIAVVPGATVTGTNAGIIFATGTVLNAGTISGGNFGIETTAVNSNATVNNSGSISGGTSGIATGTATVSNSGSIIGTTFAGIEATTANVSNSGSIAGGSFGITATTATVSNSGSIAGSSFGIEADNTATVSNSGSITGALVSGISANTANVSNSGSIIGTTFFGIFANTSATVSNSGSISGGTTGIAANTTATVSNSGSISGGTADGIFAGTDATVTNSGSITGGTGIFANTTATVSNSGSIAGVLVGIQANIANVSNSGSISGAISPGIFAITSANVTNSGSIRGADGIQVVTGTATVSNSGSITGGHDGIEATTANVSNSGSIAGGHDGIFATLGSNVTNSGTISGGTAALQFAGNPDTLTLLPGSRIIGAINLGGGGDTVNFRTGNQNLTFDTLTGATVTSTVPFAVSGNRVATIDPTPFAMTDRNLMDFSRAVSSAIPVIETQNAAVAGAGAFAAMDNSAGSRFDDAFAAIPGMSAYASDAAVFKNPTAVYRDGSAVWARGFAGQRLQPADGALLHTLNQFYGGMVGGDWQAQANLRLGAFIGAGKTRSSLDSNMGNDDSELVFGGVFGRYTWGASFLNVALQGGHLRTDTTRNINNNLAPGGLETAKASFDGWYINPEATYGVNFALGVLAGAAYTLTPSLQVRYLHASFDGFTESGSTANLTVGGRTVDNFEERGQLKLTRTVTFTPTEVLMTSLYGGALGDHRAGSTTVNATLLGQTIPFAAPGKDNVWGGFGGAGLEWHTRSVTLFASAEYLALSDSSSVVSAHGGIRIAF